MRRVLWLCCVIALTSVARPSAQGEADFSGTWTLDAARSTLPADRAGVAATLVITQTASQLTIKITEGEKSRTAIYKLDGSIGTSKTPNGDMVVSKSHWDGAKLITESRGAIGEAVVTTREIRTLEANGRDTTVETMSLTNQGASFPARCPPESTTCTSIKQVFTKVR